MEKIKKWFHKQKEILHHELTQEPPIKIIKNFAFIILGAMLVAFGDGNFPHVVTKAHYLEISGEIHANTYSHP